MYLNSLSLILILAAAACFGCSRSDDDRLSRAPKTISAAASELEEVFANADAATQKNASLATQALRDKKYSKAVVSLMGIRNQDNLSFEQGMTVRNSMVTLQRELVNAAEDGDPNATQAIKVLQQFR